MRLPEGPQRALCELLSPRRRYQQAEARFSAAIEHDPQAPLHYLHRAQARLCLRRVQSAREDAVRSLRLDPTDSEVQPRCCCPLPCPGNRRLVTGVLPPLQCLCLAVGCFGASLVFLFCIRASSWHQETRVGGQGSC